MLRTGLTALALILTSVMAAEAQAPRAKREPSPPSNAALVSKRQQCCTQIGGFFDAAYGSMGRCMKLRGNNLANMFESCVNSR